MHDVSKKLVSSIKGILSPPKDLVVKVHSDVVWLKGGRGAGFEPLGKTLKG